MVLSGSGVLIVNRLWVSLLRLLILLRLLLRGGLGGGFIQGLLRCTARVQGIVEFLAGITFKGCQDLLDIAFKSFGTFKGLTRLNIILVLS
mgnify:CR=1 FL=1